MSLPDSRPSIPTLMSSLTEMQSVDGCYGVAAESMSRRFSISYAGRIFHCDNIPPNSTNSLEGVTQSVYRILELPYITLNMLKPSTVCELAAGSGKLNDEVRLVTEALLQGLLAAVPSMSVT